MKTSQRRLLTLWAACSALLLAFALPSARAADQKPPGKMAFQGFLTDGSGNPRGQAAPLNLTVTFRLFNSPTAAATLALWGESQVVTVDKGHFSVVLGEGTAIAGAPSATDLANYFTGDNANGRYLGVTVEGESEITPRIQFLAAPYAHLARFATELVGSSGQSLLRVGADKVGINLAAGAVPASALDVGGTVTATAFSGNGANLTALNASQLTTGTVPDARLSANVARRDVANTFAGNQTMSGNLGIGAAPGARLHLVEATGTVRTPDNATLLLDHENNGGASSIVFRSRVNRGGGDHAWIQYQDAAAINGAGESSVLSIGTGNDGDDHIALMPASGRVGLGVMAPKLNLDLPGGSMIGSSFTSVNQHDGSNRGMKVAFGYNDGDFVGIEAWVGAGLAGCGNSGEILFKTWECNTATSREVMRINGRGHVGIGTGSPGSARLSVAGGYDVTGLRGAYVNGANVGNVVTHGAHSISIYTAGTIWAGNSVIATSDERIKSILGRSDGVADLNTLLRIEITDFRYKDTVKNGAASHKKVIAQQVEKVFPNAVSQQTEVVPDLFQKAAIKDGWVTLATNLKKGDRVRLIGDTTEGVHEVLEVADGKFRTEFVSGDGQVFVYGREVSDFRTVDYEAISMLNVSATQQIKKEKDAEVKALQDENAALKARLETLEANDKNRVAELSKMDTLERELTALKKMVAQMASVRAVESATTVAQASR